MKFFALLLGLAALLGSALAEPEDFTPVLNTKLGEIRGLVRTVDDKKVHVYEGIKYGK